MNFDDLIRESVQSVLAETNAENTNQPGTKPAAAGPITLTIQGQQVTFRDQADLEAQLNSTAQAIAAQKAAAPAAPPAAISGSKVTGDDDAGPSFNNDEYIRLMNEDPRKATNYALSHLMFDGKVDDPAALIRETMITQATQSRQLAAYQFTDAHREVPISDPRVGGVIETVRTELGLPFNAQGLEAAYIYAVNKGRLPDFRQLAAQTQQQQQLSVPNQQQIQQNQDFQPQYQYGQPQQQFQQPQNQYLQAPPAPGRSTNVGAPLMIGDIEDMSLDQLEKVLRKVQSAGGI